MNKNPLPQPHDSRAGFSPQTFVRSVGLILCVTGLAKLVSAFGHTPIVRLAEPITQIQFRQLFIVAGVAELFIAAYCILSKKTINSLLVIAWLSTVFLAYRLSLFWIGWKLPCPCLGNLVPTLHISPFLADMIMKIIMAYMLIGSYIHLSLIRWLRKSSRTSCPMQTL